MADWTAIPDTALDPDAPLTSELAYAWRDNPIAIAEGASGAPRIVDAALVAGSATNNGGNFVGNRIANLMGRSGAPVGTIILARYGGPNNAVTFGSTVGGSTLTPSSAGQTAPGGSAALTGTWVCLGYAITTTSNGDDAATLWCRIS